METMDSTQASTIETPDLSTLWTNLTDINSCIGIAQAQQKAPYTAVDFELEYHSSFRKFRRRQSRKLQAIIERLEGPRDSLRLIINQRIRPNLRPLNILSLPNELLRQIFEYVRGDRSMYRFFFLVNDGDVEQVKKLRLTCRRFCENSSHLLMSGVKVDMTPLSIAHFIEVSQHPTISKGIRAVQVNVGRHYDSGKAQDIMAFTRFHRLNLRTRVQRWEESVRFPLSFDRTPTEVYERGIEQAIPILESWEEAAEHGVIENCPEHDVLRKAYQHYRQCHESQKRLVESGAFAQTISSAMQRMPTATWLNISSADDMRLREARESRLLYCVRPEDLDDPNLLELIPKLQTPETSWSMASYDGLISPPINILPSILLSIEQAGITLTGLDICVDPPPDLSSLSATEVEYPKLRATSQKLKTFQFFPRRGSNIAMDILGGFLSTILDTSALQQIDLDFDFLYKNRNGHGDDAPTPTMSMAPLVLARTWPNLKRLQYNGPFYFKELQRVINRIGKQHVDLQWSGYLMDASWAEVLDFLRGRVTWKYRLGNINGSIAGAECDDMTYEEVSFLFGEDHKARYGSGSRATHYIEESSDSNPVRDWVNGDLVMPEPAAEEDVNGFGNPSSDVLEHFDFDNFLNNEPGDVGDGSPH